jgi:hypothetical protein
MKAFLASVVVAIGVAFGASQVLHQTFQTTSPDAFTTEGARISDPGSNLVQF